MKITLSCGSEGTTTITTTCAGVSLHGAVKAAVHGLSQRGKAWAESHMDESIMVTTKNSQYHLTEITSAPLP